MPGERFLGRPPSEYYSTMQLTPGKKLGPYEIVSPLGAGGMGEVYRARDTRLGREVAIKVLPRHLSANPEVRARFEREAKTVSALNHPHICTLFDVGREGDADYLVMELVEGETLASRLARGPLSSSDTLRIGVEIADALDQAHRARIVHRDLKPGNVMLTKSGAKLMDFGLARATGLADTPGSELSKATLAQSPTVGQPLTAEGTIVGTFQYMAPEQLEGKEADERSDIWALGCVLYEMATGKPAFAGRSQATLISSIMTAEPPPISQLTPMTPPAFDRLVRTCIAKDPVDRVQSAHDVRLQLAWIAEAGSQAGTAAPVAKGRRRREGLAWMVAAACLLVAAGSSFVALRHRASPIAGSAHLVLAMPENAPFTSFEMPTISPDGSAIVVVGKLPDGGSRLYLRPIDRDEMRVLEGTDGGQSPFWSPDGLQLGFFADGKLKRVAAAGGPARILCDAPVPTCGGAWGSAKSIVFGGGEGQPMLMIPEDGGTPKPVTQLHPLDQSHRWPAFLPDGQRFVYLADARRTEDHWLRVGSTEGDLDVAFLQNAITSVAFSAPDWLYFVRGGTLLAQRFDTKKMQLTGEPVPIAKRLFDYLSHQFEFSCSATGAVVFRSVNPLRELAWYDRDGKRLETVGRPERYGRARLSPDNRNVAYAVMDADGRYDQVYVLDLERGTVSRPTTGAGDYSYVTWSPDGQQIVFGGTATGTGCTYRSSVFGTTRDEVVRCGKLDCWPTDWSHDGQWILMTKIDSGDTTRIVAHSMEDPKLEVTVLETVDAADNARFSPDGRWVAYSTKTAGSDEIYVQDFPAARHRQQVSASGGGVWPLWAAGGREILYQGNDDAIMAVEVHTANGLRLDAPRMLFQLAGAELLDTSADGRRLLLEVRMQDPVTAPVQVVLDWRRETAAR